jgi:BirA family transcriptional regulator, biotin operon repressor / biotin---[acetyl-CoA-carboxylase] ligase
VTIRRYETLDSTNEEARRLGEAGEQAPLWIMAREQTAGRGRRGREWVSARGNLFATLLLRPGKPADVCAQLSFAAALAVGDVVAQFAPAARVALKWPNDVLLDGKKVAGILLESSGGRTLEWLAVGIGINLANSPSGTETPAISFTEITGSAPDADDALARLAARWNAWYGAWMKTGFAALKDAWLARAAGLGERVTARLGTREVQGVFEGLADDGALILRENDGSATRIAAGEVFFRA